MNPFDADFFGSNQEPVTARRPSQSKETQTVELFNSTQLNLIDDSQADSFSPAPTTVVSNSTRNNFDLLQTDFLDDDYSCSSFNSTASAPPTAGFVHDLLLPYQPETRPLSTRSVPSDVNSLLSLFDQPHQSPNPISSMGHHSAQRTPTTQSNQWQNTAIRSSQPVQYNYSQPVSRGMPVNSVGGMGTVSGSRMTPGSHGVRQDPFASLNTLGKR